jgi:pimeloyl-ACP methyl ester carboxylesterase
MTVARINGITLGYDDYGSGDPILLVTGTAAPGRTWRTHQVPALRTAGFRVITMDNRGIPPSDTCPGGFTFDDMAADVAGLIEHLHLAPCRVVGYSLGALIVQELLVARPELVRQAVLMATMGRSDALTRALSAADVELAGCGGKLPARYAAAVTATQNLSPETLNDEQRLKDWLDILELSPVDLTAVRPQLGLEVIADRRPAYRSIACPCLVIGFADDLIARPHLCREVAQAIPGALYREIAGCGHFGYLEKPGDVNAAIVEFFS